MADDSENGNGVSSAPVGRGRQIGRRREFRGFGFPAYHACSACRSCLHFAILIRDD